MASQLVNRIPIISPIPPSQCLSINSWAIFLLCGLRGTFFFKLDLLVALTEQPQVHVGDGIETPAGHQDDSLHSCAHMGPPAGEEDMQLQDVVTAAGSCGHEIFANGNGIA